MSQVALNTLVAHYIDMGRRSELDILETKAKKGRTARERGLLMIAFARARLSHTSFGKRLGLK